ncbi:MAG TPA: hypothetical protein VIO94_15115 [Phenylobacterium sp.]
MTAIAAAPAKLDIGRVISTTFGVLRHNFLTFLGLTVLLVGLPLLIAGLGTIQLLGAGENGGTAMAGGFGLVGVSGLVALITNAMLQGALVFGTVQALNGRQATFGECLATGLRNFLPLIGLAIVMGLGVFAGLFIFLIPGVMIALAWFVAVPAKVTENIGVFSALGRSADLTRDNRWLLLGLTLLFMVGSWVVSLALSPLSLIGMSGGPTAVVTTSVVVSTLGSIISSIVGSTGIAVTYTELRRVKEGTDVNSLAALFD